MGTRKICIKGLSTTEMDLLEIKIREMASQIAKAAQGIVDIWREDEEDGSRIGDEQHK